MRRAASLLLIAALVLLAACAPTHQYADIEGSDSESRYPAGVADARDNLTRAAAMALVLFTGWLAVDVARRRRQGAAVATAAVLVGALLVASFVARTSGRLPQGRPYQVAMAAAFWLGPAALIIGATWVIWAFDYQPTNRGEARWGLFLILFGIVMTPMILLGVFIELTDA